MPEMDSLKPVAAQVEWLVEHWFFEVFHGSAIARSTDVWNTVHAAKEDLKHRLTSLLAQPPRD